MGVNVPDDGILLLRDLALNKMINDNFEEICRVHPIIHIEAKVRICSYFNYSTIFLNRELSIL